MNTRTLTLTGALLLATVICLFLWAAPQELQKAAPPVPEPVALAQTERSAAPPSPPVTFSDPDGQELILEELQARTAIQGMLSLTELEFRFRNPQNRRIEGRFTCTLPPNAAISRFAKDVNGHLMEGEVVERLRANQVYEQFLHQMRDPALLEQDQGNRFSARIFPIEANAPVTIVLSYTALLPLRDGVRTYTLPLRGMQKVNKFTFRGVVAALPGEEQVGAAAKAASSAISGPSGASRSTAEVITLEERDYTPPTDIVLSWRPTSEASRSRVLKAGDFYLAAFRPEVTRRNGAAAHDWLFYFDTSASSAEGAEHRIRAFEAMLYALPPQDRVQVIAFDQELAPLASGTAIDVARTIAGLIRKRHFLGGTDLGALLRDVGRNAQDRPARAIVVASDLVATLGNTDRKDVTDAIRAIPATATVHALILGSRQDAPIARTLTAGRGRIVDVPFTDSLVTSAREAAAALSRPLGVSFDASDSSAEWVYPTHFDDVQPGDEVIVLGKLKAAAEPAVRLGGTSIATSSTLPSGTFAPLLEREAYRAYLDYLAEREANEPSEAVRRALATEQVKVSVEQRVVIPRTTMLVLESEWEYQRFGLDRRALAAILTIDAGGIARIDRRGNDMLVAPMPMPVPPPPPVMRRERGATKTAPPVIVPQAVPTQPVMEDSVQGVAVGSEVSATAGAAPAADFVMPPEEPMRAGSVAESITVTQQAPANAPPPPRAPATVAPPPPPPPPVPAPEQKRQDRSWTKVQTPSRARIEELETKLRANPKDRELYNQLSEVLAAHNEWTRLRELALRWQPYDPENPQVYEVLGLAGEHLGNESESARAYASLIEVAPAKTELLQRAGLLLLRARKAKLAEAPLRKALSVRPDRVNSYRHLALMLWQDGRIEEAARVLESATRQTFPGWYGDVQRVVREELGYVYRAWLAKEPARQREIQDRAREYNVDLTRRDALRVTLAWETDANDVDLHVTDPRNEECFYSNKQTKSGLTLYQDITQGLGPEVIRTERVERGTYHIGVRYFSAGPMGVSRGLVVVMRGDGPDVEIHPFRLVQGGGDIRYVAAVNVK
ncbi:MAG TPA: VIT domain-containing protein [Thermoanaerobaculia bacterium]